MASSSYELSCMTAKESLTNTLINALCKDE
jgi:hypothetical protein